MAWGQPGSWLRLCGSETANLWELLSRIGLVSLDLQGHYTGRSSAMAAPTVGDGEPEGAVVQLMLVRAA